jgi:nucleoid DNA-binding protein
MLGPFCDNRTMTKRNIVRRIADELKCSELETKLIVQKTLDTITNVLAEEGRVELRDFGVFAVKKRKPRLARNPRTGEKVMVGERFAVTFKPGRVVEERVAMERCGSSVPAEGSVTLANQPVGTPRG